MMKRFLMVVAVCGMSAIGGMGCNSTQKESAAPASQAQHDMDMAPAGDSLSGKVVETMNSGGYTYVCLEKNGKKTWVAVPESKVKVGQELKCQAGGEMKNFTSKTLNRTFESIIFSPGIR